MCKKWRSTKSIFDFLKTILNFAGRFYSKSSCFFLGRNSPLCALLSISPPWQPCSHRHPPGIGFHHSLPILANTDKRTISRQQKAANVAIGFLNFVLHKSTENVRFWTSCVKIPILFYTYSIHWRVQFHFISRFRCGPSDRNSDRCVSQRSPTHPAVRYILCQTDNQFKRKLGPKNKPQQKTKNVLKRYWNWKKVSQVIPGTLNWFLNWCISHCHCPCPNPKPSCLRRWPTPQGHLWELDTGRVPPNFAAGAMIPSTPKKNGIITWMNNQ